MAPAGTSPHHIPPNAMLGRALLIMAAAPARDVTRPRPPPAAAAGARLSLARHCGGSGRAAPCPRSAPSPAAAWQWLHGAGPLQRSRSE
ncbi:unnamed protein product [Caretta caretta]